MRPTVILPGYLAAATEYGELIQSLRSLTDAEVVVVPLKRWDWLATIGGRPVTPIIQMLEKTIRQVLAKNNHSQVNLVGHSAGGWISRIFLGNETYCGDRWNGLPLVSKLITLGTPHLSEERWTRKTIDFVNSTYPGAFHDQLDYVCIAGKALFGKKSWRPADRFTYESYKLTCGAGDRWGDGVTPIEAAHLDGAQNLTLEDVLHSPKSRSPMGNPPVWYGTQSVVEQWATHLS